MKKKVFVGYSSQDQDKVTDLCESMEKTQLIEPLVVANRRNPGKLLTEKVITGIKDADCLMPILTEKSVSNQWVNQEIGYAKARGKEPVPLVDTNILNDLKGFINKEMDLPYKFTSYPTDSERETESFRNCVERALDYVLRSFLRIKEPKEDEVTDEYIEVSGSGANPKSAIVLVTSLYGKYLAVQEGGVFADANGDWHHSRCHLFNINKRRFVYALAVSPSDENRVVELLEEHGKHPKARAMDRFKEILQKEGIVFESSPPKFLMRVAS